MTLIHRPLIRVRPQIGQLIDECGPFRFRPIFTAKPNMWEVESCTGKEEEGKLLGWKKTRKTTTSSRRSGQQMNMKITTFHYFLKSREINYSPVYRTYLCLGARTCSSVLRHCFLANERYRLSLCNHMNCDSQIILTVRVLFQQSRIATEVLV